MCVKLGLCVKSFSIRDRTGSKARCQNWSAASYHTSFSSHKWNDTLTKWQIDKSHLQTQRQPTSLFTVHSILSNEHQKISDLQSIHIHHEDPGVSIISKNWVFFYKSRYSGFEFFKRMRSEFFFLTFHRKAVNRLKKGLNELKKT